MRVGEALEVVTARYQSAASASSDGWYRRAWHSSGFDIQEFHGEGRRYAETAVRVIRAAEEGCCPSRPMKLFVL